MEERYCTIEHVAGHYRVSISTVRAWIRQNIIPFIKIGGVYRLKISEIDAAFKQQPKQPEDVSQAVQQITAIAAPQEAVVINPDQDV